MCYWKINTIESTPKITPIKPVRLMGSRQM